MGRNTHLGLILIPHSEFRIPHFGTNPYDTDKVSVEIGRRGMG